LADASVLQKSLHPQLLDKSFKKRLKKAIPFLFFIAPGFIFFIVFSYIPLYGLVGAFQDYDPVLGFFKSRFIGLENFRVLFALPDFPLVVRNTLVISLWNLLICFPAPIILALLYHEIANPTFKKITQTISYIPYFVSWVVVSGIFYKLLASGGVINDLLTFLHMIKKPVYFMSERSMFVPIVVISSLWKSVGFNTIIYLAALTAINPELYEASDVDGASTLQKHRYITIPGIMPTIVLLLILAVSNILNVNFEQLWTLQNQQVYEVSEVIDTYIFRIFLKGQLIDYARGIAIGLIRAVICLILFFVGNGIMKRLRLGSLI
jgi:putative aldouronate transport system permease protein